MKKRRSIDKYIRRKRVIPVAIGVTSRKANCLVCQDTGVCDYTDEIGFHGQIFCQCPIGIKLSRSYEEGKCPLCQNSSYVTLWKDSPNKPGRKDYRRVRCSHFKKRRY